MEDSKQKQKDKEKKNNNSKKNPSQKKPKQFLTENKLIKHKINQKRLVKKKSKDVQINSDFNNKIELPKKKVINDSNKSVKEDNIKKILSFDNDKKNVQNSVSQDLITKILDINIKKFSSKDTTSNFFLYQKEDTFSNNINSIRSNRINNNNQNILECKEESKISNKTSENNKVYELNPHIKNINIKQEISKNKNNKNAICRKGTQDFRKDKNIKLDSVISFTDHQSENEYKYNSSITDNIRNRIKKAKMHFDLHQINENNSNKQLTFRMFSQNNLAKTPVSQRSNLKNNYNEVKLSSMSKKQKEIAQSILELDLVKLKKEIYDYENTDITDAINRLPTHKFDSDKINNKRKKIINKNFKTKSNKRIKVKKNIKERFRILRKVGYVYDSFDDEECEDEEDNNFYFEPNGNFIFILDFIILISSFFYLVFFPIYLSRSPFNEKNLIKELFFNFIDIIFIIDFISGFFTAYINFDEDLIKNNILIIKNYLKTWFLLDFFCSIPVYSILNSIKNKFEENNHNKSCYFNYNGKNLYRLFELIKLLKIIKAFKSNIARKKIKHKIKKISFFYYWGSFIKHIFIFISILNLSSCLFILSARNSYPNWILNLNMNIQNYISIYICSCYYIIMTVTTVGYGDIEIFSMTERIFEIFFLIIGTCLYSWMLTSASNYIKKMNEKDIKFEQKLDILDDIKTNYPLMSNDLYIRIYKLLYYTKCHEEVDKKIIIDSLPYSIRNSLLIQMYYPIITNFKFFKYFGNSEFIIEIVSVLKPLIGIKGDFLINEGEYVEDIILNKSGVLSLEICIDLDNPREFIEEYLIKYNLENIRYNKNLESNIEFNPIYKKNSIYSSNFSKSSFNFNKTKNSSIKSNNNKNFVTSIKKYGSISDKEKLNKNNFHYLKLINIGEKEHFGDVLMFLNEPSPLNVRVSSKNAEVLLLNKTDVVEISSNFPNIWKRINENSIFNLEQIKILIMRKLSTFCYSNDIKIKSLYSKKDTKTGQNKINYSLIPIPDSTQVEKLNQSINLNETTENKSKDSENNFSQSFENFNENNTYIIKEVQSSEKSGTNTILSNDVNYSYEYPKKVESKKMCDSINISMQKKNAIDENINSKKNNRCYDQNIIENRNQLLSNSGSYSNFHNKKNSDFSNKNAKNSIETSLFKINTNTDNTITNENYSPKHTRESNLNNSPITDNNFNTSIISSPKNISKYQNFDEKSKMNKKLISIPSFNFIQNYDNNNLNDRTEYVNDEIYPNENFDIKIPDNDQSLMINNNIESQEKDFPESPKKLLNSIKEEEKHDIISNNLNSNNKFNNLTISSISTLEIKSSYDNINEFTKYRFISNESLIKKTKIFLSKECGFYKKTKLSNISYHTPTNHRGRRSEPAEKLSKCLQKKKIYDYNNISNNLSLINDNDINSPITFSRELKNLGFKKNKKDNVKLLENSINDTKELNKSFAFIKKNATIKEKKLMSNKKNSTCINIFKNFSPKKSKRKTDISFDNLLENKTRNKLDLITKNLKRDSENLNNPDEFYADLFHNFYKLNIKKRNSRASTPNIRVTQNTREKKNSEEDEENCLYNN